MTAEPFSCVVIGEEPLLVECTRLLLARGHRVAAVVSPAEELISWAEGEGLPAVRFGGDLAGRLAPLEFDYLFSIANLRMLPAEVLALPARLPVNFHDGPLPRHAGLFATSWAILDGDKEHGVTWHVMTDEADTGDVLKQRDVPVGPAATVHELDVACFDAAVESFAELVDELAAGTATRTPQDLDLRTYHGKYDGLPRGGVVDWRRPAAELDALVRATAFGHRRNDLGTPLLALGGRLLAVRGAEVSDRPSTEAPGTVVGAGPDALTVATADRDVRLTDLTDLADPAGERLDPAAVADLLASDHGGRFPHPADDAVAELEQAGRAAHRQERHWLGVLGTLDPLLPPRIGRLPETTAAAGPVALPGALRATGAEPAAVALAAVLALLARLTRGGERDVALTTAQTTAGTTAPADGPARGLLAAEVPLRGPEGLLDRTLPELAGTVAAAVAAVRTRSPYRRDVLLRHPGLATARAGLPVAVVLPDADADTGTGIDTDAGTSTAAGTGAGAGQARALTVRIDAEGTVGFEPGAGFTDRQAAWTADRLRLLLAAAAAEPGRPLGTLALLGAEEQRLLRDRWNDTAEEYPRETTVSRLVADLACAAPAATAVRFEDRTLGYAELDQAADRLARRLVGLGAGPGTFVGVYLERSPELLVALLAVLKSGAAYVPIDPIYPPGRIRHMLEDSGAALVLTDARLGGTLADVRVTVVPVTPAEAGGEPPAAPLDRSDPDAPAYVIYTSGSTGLPKGVQVGHRALVNFLWTMARYPGFGSGDSLLALTTVCFDIAGLELYLPLTRGGTVELLPEAVAADGFALRQRIERSRPTVLQATPTTWQMLLAAGWEGDRELRALCGGEPLPAELADRLAGRVGALYNMYGPTETTIWSTVDRVRAGEPVTIGRPIGNTRCHVLDERGLPVPPGLPGELYLSGDGVADGYLGRAELTAERFVTAPAPGAGRAYRTGDLVRHLPDGRLEYLERIDGQIKLNGYRIELGEVESALRRLPGVTAAVALVREDRPGERRLAAYVAGGDGPLPERAGLRAALRERLPAYMVPAAVTVLPKLPLTPNGKIDRKALPAPDLAGPAGVPAGTELERRIAGVWCEVLGLERVGAEDNFFDVGGDSLRLTSVAALLRERLGLPVTRLGMFRHPTVRAMASALAGPADAPVSAPAPAGTPQRRSRDVAALAERRNRRGRRS
ncbi:amino acid adenylation domain-containing protein [Kitasatospora sp. NPDC047058]|uniref:amino acid adenylation domain-containing protein n=1 Tax=Kitasatospora sp. NPDC047058 TaxID=3155620 RepID=UPI0033EA8147